MTGWSGRLLAGSLAALAGCGVSAPEDVRDVATETHEVDVVGSTRTYRAHVPPSVEPGAPVLLVFHGAAQPASGIEVMSWLYPEADAEGMILVFPQSDGDYWNTPNSPASYWSTPDVQFADAILADLSTRHDIDPTRVYAAGYSNGAIFAQVLACLRGETIAAYAVVGAGISLEVSESCPWTRPVPAVVFFGDTDPQFSWDDGVSAPVGMLGGPGSLDWLAEQNGCTTASVASLPEDPASGTSAELHSLRDCTDAADVDFYRIRGGGHTWPGSPVNLGAGFGAKIRTLDASAVMVAFFSGHRLGGAS